MPPPVPFDALAELVRLQLGSRTVRPTDRLVEDLGAVSMDLMRIAVAVEDRFGVFLDESDLAACDTAGTLYEAVLRAQRDAP